MRKISKTRNGNRQDTKEIKIINLVQDKICQQRKNCEEILKKNKRGKNNDEATTNEK